LQGKPTTVRRRRLHKGGDRHASRARRHSNRLDSAAEAGGDHQTAAVLNDPDLATYEKRVLSSWASDRHAVESCPWLRSASGAKRTLRLSDILAALRAFDDDDEPPPPGGVPMRIAGSQQEVPAGMMARSVVGTVLPNVVWAWAVPPRRLF
jgi:hypothetical protein